MCIDVTTQVLVENGNADPYVTQAARDMCVAMERNNGPPHHPAVFAWHPRYRQGTFSACNSRLRLNPALRG